MDRKNIRLPEGVSALSGAVRLWPSARRFRLGHRFGLVVEQCLDAGGRLGVDCLDHGLDRAEVGDRIGVGDCAAGVRHVVTGSERQRDVVAYDRLQPLAESGLPIFDHGLQQRVSVAQRDGI